MNSTLWIVACAIGATAVAVLALVYRRAAARRALEVADEILDEEIRTAARDAGT